MNRHVIARSATKVGDEAISLEIATIPVWTLYLRAASEFLIRPLLPRVIIDKNQALQKVHDAGKKERGW